ncbi:hypothetical protein GH714_018590 [Hevea brasiliensis]|uniref:DUF7870 domain-containing protein n=1 Tax=Hevea brasiliensis TaxID=3981 RepID=A0A6A6LZN6_HEVBR|nr:hypothetical protein GH714_018590 [Hevea brasiliensis]
MVDISFKNRYVYVDVGARSYGSSIGSWFRKQYPKQNRTFDVYAIEADKTFHEEYRVKKGVTLLPYAAWVRNETLSFEINHDPGQEVKDKGRGMGRIQSVKLSKQDDESFNGEVDEIQGFDFAMWLKKTVTEKDFVHLQTHGFPARALEIFHKMLKAGVRPNEITCIAVLSACSHVGLIYEGWKNFKMSVEHGIVPRMEHYACMVDLLGRLKKLSSSLTQCPSRLMLWSFVHLGKHAAMMIHGQDPNDPAAYIFYQICMLLMVNGMKWHK